MLLLNHESPVPDNLTLIKSGLNVEKMTTKLKIRLIHWYSHRNLDEDNNLKHILHFYRSAQRGTLCFEVLKFNFPIFNHDSPLIRRVNLGNLNIILMFNDIQTVRRQSIYNNGWR